ncbi:MAG: folate family ECF transporter S component [Corallococcus sp.]|nr:folate family ECF transporter S component [Corallococcus sp.]
MEQFRTCFCKGYWESALAEFKRLRSVVVCALFVALRVAVKSIKIPIMPGLSLTFDFFVNSLGAMIYGPLLGLVGGAVSDTIGAVLFPSGPYFFPFIFVEMSSAFIFGLYLYRCRLTTLRVILARFSVIAFCNLFLNTLCMYWSSQYFGEAFKMLTWTRFVKNLALWPIESVILTFFLGAVALPLARSGWIPASNGKIKLAKADILLLVILAVAAILFSIGAILLWQYLKKQGV